MGYLKKNWNNYCDSKVCFGDNKNNEETYPFSHIYIDKQSGKGDPNNNNSNNEKID